MTKTPFEQFVERNKGGPAFKEQKKILVRAVTMGRVKRTERAKWEPAILLLEAPGLSSVVRGVTTIDGAVLQNICEYIREEYLGSFVVPPEES